MSIYWEEAGYIYYYYCYCYYYEELLFSAVWLFVGIVPLLAFEAAEDWPPLPIICYCIVA